MEVKFSRTEIVHLAASTVALSFAFSLVLYRKEIFQNFNYNPLFFLNSLIIVGLAFILHEEFGHKIIAQKYGCWAEYRAWPTGLFFAVMLAVISRGNFVFAAPGAVMISNIKKIVGGFEYTHLPKEAVGKIAIAGSVVNIILAFLFFGINKLIPSKVFSMASTVNIWLALFNMIPFDPLDGAKVLRWNKNIWIGMLILCIFLFFLFSISF